MVSARASYDPVGNRIARQCHLLKRDLRTVVADAEAHSSTVAMNTR